MSGRIFTDEERESAKRNRREARQRLVDETSATVDQLLCKTLPGCNAFAPFAVMRFST
jgi:hypothetical protein